MQPAFRSVLAPFVALLAWVKAGIDSAKESKFGRSTLAAVESTAINLVFVVVGVIVVVLVIAALAGTYFDALADLGDNFTTVELGSTAAANIAETIIETLAILVLIAGAFLLVGFALRAFKAKS